MTTFLDLLTPAQQADVALIGMDFNGQVRALIQANTNTAANRRAQLKVAAQDQITGLLPNITQTQLQNLQSYVQSLGVASTASLFEQLTPDQLQHVITIITK